MTVKPKSARVVEFQIGNLPLGPYEVYGEGQGRYSNFRETHSLTCIDTKVIIEVGTLVNFQLRNTFASIFVVIVSKDGLQFSIHSDNTHFHLTNPSGERRQLHANEIQFLPDNLIPVTLKPYVHEIGQHTIEATYGSNVKFYTFDVIEFEPVPFDVVCDTYVIGNISEHQLVVDVETKTKTGEIIEGVGVVNVKYNYEGMRPGKDEVKNFNMKIPKFYGKVQVKRSLDDLGTPFENVYRVSVDIEELVNGYKSIRSVDCVTSSMVLNKFIIKPITVVGIIKPGIKFYGKFIVKTRQGNPVANSDNPVLVGYTFDTDMEKLSMRPIRVVPIDGVFEFHIDIPKDKLPERLTYQMEYLDAETTITIGRAYPESEQYIQVQFLDRNVIEVSATEPLSSATYIVKSPDRQIIDVKTVSIPNLNVWRIKLEDISQFLDQCEIEVRYTSPTSGTIVKDSTKYQRKNACAVFFEGESQHTKHKVFNSGDNVTIDTDCPADSTISVFVIDANMFERSVPNAQISKSFPNNEMITARYVFGFIDVFTFLVFFQLIIF